MPNADGQLSIADCRFPIYAASLELVKQIGNRQSAIDMTWQSEMTVVAYEHFGNR
jgi:hypothetical protein